MKLLLVFALLLAACGPVREAVMVVTPGVPARESCDAGAGLCRGGVPLLCSSSGRWWPALPRDAYGTQRMCPAGCEVTDAGVPFCSAPDGGPDAR